MIPLKYMESLVLIRKVYALYNLIIGFYLYKGIEYINKQIKHMVGCLLLLIQHNCLNTLSMHAVYIEPERNSLNKLCLP